jgi:hypothetical protein
MAKKFENMGVYVNKAVNSNLFVSASKFTGLLMKFTMNSDKNLITYESKESILLSNKNIIQEMIKFGKRKIVKVVYEKSYPKIAFREKIYMRRNYPEISLEYIKSLLSKIYGEEIINKNFGRTTQKKREKLDENKIKLLPLWAKKVNKEDKKYYVSTRILNCYPLKFKTIKDFKEENKEEEIKSNNNKTIDDKDSDDNIEEDNKSKSQRKLPKIRFPSINFPKIKVPSIKVPSIKVPTKFIKLFKNKSSDNNRNQNPKALMIYIHGGGFLNTSFFFS